MCCYSVCSYTAGNSQSAAPAVRLNPGSFVAAPFSRYYFNTIVGDGSTNITFTQGAFVNQIVGTSPALFGTILTSPPSAGLSASYTGWVNAVSTETGGSTFTTYGDTTGTVQLFGANGPSSVSGSFGEIILVPTLTTSNRQSLEGYLAWHWG